ncbi:HAAS signaling domain-containing protein [Tenuibacillus multivorans]|nr:hypothetical protein [Tenuibacillus multivorans]GEL76503.1 hypothetical protein TMU01_07380 [Tenuibacillus multivorans]
MKMIDRYLYAVSKRLPPSQREDISEELRGLIEDMLDSKVGDREATEQDVEEVLVALGSPSELAAKYGGVKESLIGPRLYYTYISVIKVVLFSILLAMGVVFAIEIIMDPVSILEHFIDFITNTITVAVQALLWVTVCFVIADYNGWNPRSLTKGTHYKWSPKDLPIIPDPKKQIKRSESIIGIIFSILFLIFVTFSNHLIGMFFFENDDLVGVAPFLDQDVIGQYLPIIYLIVAVGVLKECLKLIIGKWTKNLAIFNLLINGVILALIFILLKDNLIWNPHFMQDLTQLSDVEPGTEIYSTIEKIWDNSRLGLVVVFLIGVLIDTVISFYKALRKDASFR